MADPTPKYLHAMVRVSLERHNCWLMQPIGSVNRFGDFSLFGRLFKPFGRLFAVWASFLPICASFSAV